MGRIPAEFGRRAGTPVTLGLVSEKEPVARTAGRYVRAAGIAFKKERERLAAEAERKRAAEAAQAAQVAAQQPPQPPPQAVAPPPPPAAPAQPAKASRPAPLAPPPNKFLDRILWLGFIVTIIATCLVLLSIDSVLSGMTKTVFRLVIGAICFGYAGILLTNTFHAKDRVLAVMTKKLWGLEQPRTRMGRFMRGVAKDFLTLLAIGWLAVGTLDLLRVIVN
jgi:hypothetical protein